MMKVMMLASVATVGGVVARALVELAPEAPAVRRTARSRRRGDLDAISDASAAMDAASAARHGRSPRGEPRTSLSLPRSANGARG